MKIIPQVDPPSNFPPSPLVRWPEKSRGSSASRFPQQVQPELPSIFRRLLSESPNVLRSQSLENVPSTSNEERAVSSNAEANADKT